jgi:hypothetical protein
MFIFIHLADIFDYKLYIGNINDIIKFKGNENNNSGDNASNNAGSSSSNNAGSSSSNITNNNSNNTTRGITFQEYKNTDIEVSPEERKHFETVPKRTVELSDAVNKHYNDFYNIYYSFCPSNIKNNIRNIKSLIDNNNKDFVPIEKRFTLDNSTINRDIYKNFCEEKVKLKAFEREKQLEILKIIKDTVKSEFESKNQKGSPVLLQRRYDISTDEFRKARLTEKVYLDSDKKYRVS